MRTWEENKAAINQLWPTQWNAEEAKLLHDDLSPLDQSMLYDAIRNTKRTHDTPFVHLKWLLDEYRALSLARRHALRPQQTREEKLQLAIDDAEDRLLVNDFLAVIDLSGPGQFEEIEERVLDKLPQMHSSSAIRVISYARARLLGQETQFSRITRSGEARPFSVTKEDT